DCARARHALDERLDGPLDPAREADLAAHLAGCAACREHEAGMLLVRSALRSLPEVPLPDEALAEVWARTVEGGSARLARPARWAAVAAAVLVAGLTFVLVRKPGSPEPKPSQAEIAQAATEARLVLGLTARA